MPHCPSVATLARLGGDSLQGPAEDAIAAHIEGCSACQSKLEHLVRNDGTTGPSLPGAAEAPQIPGFVIEHELGRGSMSVVYQAVQPSLNRRVALKVVRSGPSGSSHDQDHWLHEARACSRLRHPNVVPLYDAGEADGWLYLVLEIVPGGALDTRLDVPFGSADGARLVETISRAVAAIHAAGLLHLDLKPSNILLDAAPGTAREQATPRVTDFGIALRWNDPDATIPGAGPLGTPRYMAPEQVAGDHTAIGPETDVYGLGAILYHVLTGRPPFAAPSIAETLEQVRSQEPVPPRRLNPAIARDLETICLKCLEKDPSRRYRSAHALADDLRLWLDGRPIAARPATILEKTWKNWRRRPAVAALAAALAFTLAGAFFSIVLLWRQALAAQRRAEADFETASDVLSQLADLTTDESNGLWASNPSRVSFLLDKSRQRLRELAARRPDHGAASRQLAVVNDRLGEVLIREGKWDHARTILEESLRDLGRVDRREPANGWMQLWRIRGLSKLSTLAARDGDAAKGVTLLDQAVRLGEERMLRAPSADLMAALVGSRSSLAVALANHGDHDRARALLKANRDLLDLPTVDLADYRMVAWRVLTRLDLSRLAPESMPIRAELALVDSRPSDPLSAVGSAQFARMPPRPWAELVLGALHQPSQAKSGGAPALKAACLVCGNLGIRAADCRHRNNLAEADQIVDRAFALSTLLVERNPYDARAYLALADAYDQLGKNAWRIPDRAAVTRNLKLALKATQRAMELDPSNEDAGFLLTRRQQKLNDLLHPK